MKPKPVHSPTPSSSTGSAGVPDLAPRHANEHVEPGEAHRTMSVWYVVLLCAFFGWGGYYTQRYSSGYTSLAYNENAMPGMVNTNAAAPIDPYVLGRRIYGDTCAKCHQPDGLGVAGQYPPLVGSEWVLAAGPARMIRIDLDGLQGPIKVKGVEYDNTMTPHRDSLNDVQLAAVITYIRTQKDWGHNASPVTPEEVAAIRAKTKDRAALGSWNAADLMAIPEHEPAK